MHKNLFNDFLQYYCVDYRKSIRTELLVVKMKKLLVYISTLLFFMSCSTDYVEKEDETLYNNGYEQYKAGEYDKAIATFQNIIDEFKPNSEVDKSRYYLGKCWIEKSKDSTLDSIDQNSYIETALSNYKTVSSKSKYWVKASFEIGYSFYKLENYDSSLAYHSSIYENYPNNSKADNALLYIGHYYRKNLDFETAIEKYELLANNYPETSSRDEAYFRIGSIHLTLAKDSSTGDIVDYSRLHRAINSFLKVGEESEKWIEAQFEIGYCYYNENDYNEALKYHESLFENYPQHSKADNALLYIGHYYRQMDELDSALVIYEQVILEYPNSGAYDNALYWAGDNYYDRDWAVDPFYKSEAIRYLTEFANIADTTDDKYGKAIKKLGKMGVTL